MPRVGGTGGARVGRDGCRVPLPWEAGAGAANGVNATGLAWLPQPELYAEYSRDRQDGVAGSTLELYKQALALRKSLRVGEGSFAWLPQFTNERALGFRNGDILVIHNFGTDALPLPQGKILVASQNGLAEGQLLDPDQTVWIAI